VTQLAQRIAEARSQLHGHYGFQDFRPLQRRVVQSILAGRDALAVLPTGGGKSICFQIPALVLGGLTVVVSPLVALMQDQVENLKRRGIAAETLNSLQPAEEQAQTLERITAGWLRLLYISPERAPRLALELLRRGIRPSLLAIDEAHCISEWGHDFRPSYRELSILRNELGRPPTVALTGSATPAVRSDIIRSLGLARVDQHIGSFDRPNLRFAVERLRGNAPRLAKVRELLAPRSGTAIVYVPTRNTADSVAQALWFSGHRAAPYHAGLPRERRTEVLRRFTAEDLDVVVATSAFGMGIDAPRVRLVAHWSMPPTPESYYQEAGRAGRDGQSARCVLLFHPQDAALHQRQLDVTFPPRRQLEALWADPSVRPRYPAGVVASADRLKVELHPESGPVNWTGVQRRRAVAESRIRMMEGYASRKRCRRAALLEWFGEEIPACSGCDACADAGKRGRWFSPWNRLLR
jgi:ATP-dependent DNA helicase RecQ